MIRTIVFLLSLAILIVLPILLTNSIVKDIKSEKKRLFAFDKEISSREYRVFALSSFAWLLSLCMFLTYGALVDTSFLPYPHDVILNLWNLLADKDILADILASVRRIFAGFFLAAILGTFLGLLAGSFKVFYAAIIPLNSFIRYIPPTVFISLLILWFGIGEEPKIFLIFLGVLFFLIQMVTDATQNVPKEYREVAFTLGTNHWDVFWKVVVPAAMPDILLAWRINMSGAWIYLVVAELIASQEGLGHLIAISQRYLNTPQLFAGIILIGFIGFLIDLGFEVLMRVLFPWRRSTIH
jgi:NitT/TauT family transport system permease protein